MSATQPQPETAHLRVVSWNVKDLTGDTRAVIRLLRELAADVYLLQEVPRRAGAAWRLGRLTQAAGLRLGAAGPGSGGTAILISSRVRVRNAEVMRLPVGHWYTRRRGAAVAQLEWQGIEFTAASLHLPLEPDRRVQHASLVHGALAQPRAGVTGSRSSSAARLIVAGDLNEGEDGAAWAALTGVRDPAPGAAPTFPAQAPSSRIDAVLLAESWHAVHYGVPELDPAVVHRASDHWPVLAELRLEEPRADSAT